MHAYSSLPAAMFVFVSTANVRLECQTFEQNFFLSIDMCLLY